MPFLEVTGAKNDSNLIWNGSDLKDSFDIPNSVIISDQQ